MTPAPTQSKSQIAYEWIRQRITSQDFTPGYRLVLGSIADELEMSVVPVREAIRRLEAEGLVTFERNVGAKVTLVDAGEYVNVMESLGIIEGAATALAAPQVTEEMLQRAEEINDLGDSFEILSDAGDFVAVREALQAAGVDYDSAESQWVPTAQVPLDKDGATKMMRVIDALEDSDDVQNVFTNGDVSDEVMAQLEDED